MRRHDSASSRGSPRTEVLRSFTNVTGAGRGRLCTYVYMLMRAWIDASSDELAIFLTRAVRKSAGDKL